MIFASPWPSSSPSVRPSPICKMATQTNNPVAIHDICNICRVKYGETNNNNGSVEVPMLLPCGHIVGNNCIDTYRKSRSQACPDCTMPLLYRGCGHEIPLVPFDGSQRQQVIEREEVPNKCVLVWYIFRVFLLQENVGFQVWLPAKRSIHSTNTTLTFF